MTVDDSAESTNERAWRAIPPMVVLTIEEQATSFYTGGRLHRARQLFEILVKMRPSAAQCWMMLGVIHRRNGDLIRALTSLQRAAELDATNRAALINLGECLVLAGRIEEGVDVMRAVFDMGFVDGAPAVDQDGMTKRAGAQLAVLRELAEAMCDDGG